MIIEDVFGDKITFDYERWNHLVLRHPEMSDYYDEVEAILKFPDLIKKSVYDNEVLLYHKFYPKIYKGAYIIIVLVKKPANNFVVTGYISKSEKRGECIWKKG